MNRLIVLILVLGVGSVSMTFVKPYPPSCLYIKRTTPHALSGLYDIAVDNTVITVYCEMALYGGGFTFVPRDAVRRGKLPSLVGQLFKDKSQVLLRFQNKNGLQPYTLIRQLPLYRRTSLNVLMHRYNGYTKPLNSGLGDYLYLGILPASIARRRTTQGFTSNNRHITFRNCDANPNSYFAFFPNHYERPISSYLRGNLVFERQGVSANWRRSGIPSYAHRQLPNDFLFLTEIHMGGCGTYTSSDRWVEAFGTAIGLR